MRSAVKQKRTDAAPAGDTQLHILILTSVFAPMVGGAGAIPEALGCCLPDHITVIAESDPGASLSAREWAVFDQRFPFPVYRLRTLYGKVHWKLPPRIRGAVQFAYNLLWIRPLLLAKIFRILRLRPAQVLCVNTIEVGYWIPRLFKRLRLPAKVIFYLHGEELSTGPVPTRHHRLVQQSLCRADALVSVSAYTRRIALAQHVAPAKIRVLNNGVDPDRFSPGPRDTALQARFGLEGKRVLLCLARFDERKGQDMLIRAMPAILQAVPTSVLLLVGSGASEPQLRHKVAEMGLEASVLFAGAATDEEVVRYYRTADVYAMPNRTMEDGDTEGFGLVFLEAGACAKPVVGGLDGGVPDAIIDGKTGYLVDGRDVTAVAASCIRLLANPELAAEMGQAGLAHARRNSWRTQSAHFLKFCQDVVRDQASAPEAVPEELPANEAALPGAGLPAAGLAAAGLAASGLAATGLPAPGDQHQIASQAAGAGLFGAESATQEIS